MNDPIVPPLRTCTKCGEEKPLTLEYFHRCKQNAQGFMTGCKVCKIEDIKRWQSENPDRVKENKRKSAEKLRSRNNEKTRERYRADPAFRERITNATEKWEAKNPDKRREANRRRSKTEPYREKNRLAQQVRSLYKVSKVEKQRMWDDQEGRCAYCGVSIFLDIPRDCGTDHIVPITRGGTKDRENTVLACRHCNSQKWTYLYDEWKAVRGW